jgi:hypothetical protein
MYIFYCVWILTATLPHLSNGDTISSSPTPLLALASPPKLGIIPTSSGQIGVKPVESDLGNPTTCVGQIYGTDKQYITETSSTTKVRFCSNLLWALDKG